MADHDLVTAVANEWIRNFERRLDRSDFLDPEQKTAVKNIFYQALAVSAIEVMGSVLLEGIMEGVRDAQLAP